MNDEMQALLRDHEALETMIKGLTTMVISNAPSCDVADAWARFERVLRQHLDSEEERLFPLATPQHRIELDTLLREHEHIRRELSELGLAIELHTLRKPVLDRLLRFLRIHAQHESRSLYNWAECRREYSEHSSASGSIAPAMRHAR